MHYGWTIVGFTFTSQFVANGLGFYAFGVLLPAIAADLEISRAAAGMIPFSMSMAGIVVGPLMGRAVTRIPIHRIVTAGAVSMSLAFYAMSKATALWHLQLGYVLGISFAMSSLGTVVAATLIVNWFEERRVLALGISGLGISLGGVVMARLTADWVEAYQWQGTYELFALIALCVAPLAWWRATTRPSDRGLAPYGASVEAAAAAAAPPPAIRTLDALKTPNLWWIAMSAGVCFMGGSAMTAHGVALAVDAGFTLGQASLVLSAIAAAAAAAKLLFSWLASSVGERGSIAIAALSMSAGAVGIAELTSSYPALIVSSALLGLGMGGVMPVQAALLARSFGAANFGPVMGLSGPILILFQSLGAPLFGWVFDVYGDYRYALLGFAAACALPILFMMLVKFPDDSEGAASADG